MYYYSIPAAVFILIVLILYWIRPIRRTKTQNLLLLLTNYTIYAFWDWRFLFLILAITFLNFSLGKVIANTNNLKNKRLLLVLNIIIHIALFCYFRYFNYFIDNYSKILSFYNLGLSFNPLKVIVPLGISIYTLQSLSYTIDIYNQKISPIKDIIAFSAYVSFFPQMIVGPIEKASNLLPQFQSERKISKESVEDGLRRILWGIFKKSVIANNCAIYSSEIFQNYADYSGFTILIGILIFALQFYADLSGLSDIAVGTASLFGFKLSTNFKFPYYSKSLMEFWSKWNISLMNWLKEYVYNSLIRPTSGPWSRMIILFILFYLVGLWHGGNGSFIVFGLYNALLIFPVVLRYGNLEMTSIRKPIKYARFFYVIQFIATPVLIIIWLTFFRAQSSYDAMQILQKMTSNFFNLSILELRSLGNGFYVTISHAILFIIYLIIEYIRKDVDYALFFDDNGKSLYKKWALTSLILLLVLFYNGAEPNYAYFCY